MTREDEEYKRIQAEYENHMMQENIYEETKRTREFVQFYWWMDYGVPVVGTILGVLFIAGVYVFLRLTGFQFTQ